MCAEVPKASLCWMNPVDIRVCITFLMCRILVCAAILATLTCGSITMMHVVSHVLTRSHGNLNCHRAGLHIDDRITTPRLLSIHCLGLNFFYIGLHVTATLFVSNQNAITAGRNNHVLAAHAKNRDIQFIHRV